MLTSASAFPLISRKQELMIKSPTLPFAVWYVNSLKV
jgi:hypothetical protein